MIFKKEKRLDTCFKLLFLIGFFYFLFFIFSKSKLDELIPQQEFYQQIVAYVDGQPNNVIPKKDSQYAVDKIECNNNAQGYWNYKNWQLNFKNLTNSNTKCKIYFVKQYQEYILNGADPVISDNLIPVTIENDGVVKKADREKLWYSYENKVWANAIILGDETKSYQNGEIIPESNIESYFVWIPRYKYKIFFDGPYISQSPLGNTAKMIDVISETKNIEASVGNQVGQYLTHPSFLSFDSNGFWVGKFETGYKDAKFINEAQKNNVDADKVVIKPNVFTWTAIQNANMYLNGYQYERKLESHMMKNMEWASVAYLSHSKYGTMTSIHLNNTQNKVTGYVANKEPSCDYDGTNLNEECNRFEVVVPGSSGFFSSLYNTPMGILGTTTGNISGIYDMAGGSWEAVMAVMLDKNGNPVSGRDSENHSGFNGILSHPSSSGINVISNGIDFPSVKYYDVYPYSESYSSFENRILGDATGEMGPFFKESSGWYKDPVSMLNEFSPWYTRGRGYYNGNSTGIFAATAHVGGDNSDIGYRIVLTP